MYVRMWGKSTMNYAHPSPAPHIHAVDGWREQDPDTEADIMASVLDGSSIPFMPPEICLAIARHLQRTDLPKFRLASKTLADVGRSELFRTIVVRGTLASWSAFKRVKEDEQISRCVRTLILDVSSWRVGTNVRDWHEWDAHCKSQANYHALIDANPNQVALYKELAGSRYYWEAYLSRLEEEKAVNKEIADSVRSGESSPEFPNLRKVHVIGGAHQLKDHHVCRLHKQERLSVTTPLSTWRGDSFSQVPNAIQLVATQLVATRRIPVATPNISKWRIDRYIAVGHGGFARTHLRNPSITSSKIRFDSSDHGGLTNTSPHYFRHYLDQWPNLESLTLYLHIRVPGRNDGIDGLQTVHSTFGVEGESAAVTSVLGEPLIWQRLRKLSLGHFDSNPRALMSLITRHGSTLRDLRLHAIWIHHKLLWNDEVPTQHSWQKVFSSIGASTDLECLRLSGMFRNGSITDDDWDFDVGGLGEYVASRIMKGGQRFQKEEILLRLSIPSSGHLID